VQFPGRVRFEWGPTGAADVAEGVDLAVVVDVLSFTTTLTVAVERGITVLPYPWRDGGAAAYAAERDAVLAIGRFEAREAGPATVSLSPAAMGQAHGVSRVVLPSPNGSSICFALAERGATVVGACLRNRAAVARWLAPRQSEGQTVAVVAAGERWPDGSLRPAVEDLWGAGAILSALDLGDASPEARMAAAAFRAVEPHWAAELAACASGRELVTAGFAEDIEVAAELDVADVVPVLDGGEFRPVTN
jgi:2-phosphosulfolactate phosphatase